MPDHKSARVPGRQNVMLAALTLSLLDVLEDAGIERGYAIELTGEWPTRLPPRSSA